MEPRLPQDLRRLVKVKAEELLKMDFFSQSGVWFINFGFELAIFVCLLQIMFNLHVKQSDLFLGLVDGNTGEFFYGLRTVPEVPRHDIVAMRRGGIRRLFIGGPIPISDDDHEMDQCGDEAGVTKLPSEPMYQRMQQAAVEDLGPDVPSLLIIAIPHFRNLERYLKVGEPDSIFTNKPLREIVEEQHSEKEEAVAMVVDPPKPVMMELAKEGRGQGEKDHEVLPTDPMVAEPVDTERDKEEEEQQHHHHQEERDKSGNSQSQPARSLWGTCISTLQRIRGK